MVRVVNDEEAGDYGDPDYLATVGVVPEAAYGGVARHGSNEEKFHTTPSGSRAS